MVPEVWGRGGGGDRGADPEMARQRHDEETAETVDFTVRGVRGGGWGGGVEKGCWSGDGETDMIREQQGQ